MKPANNAPLYCAIYPELAELVREHGYALAVHGSLAKDFDLICIPWTHQATTPEDVVKALLKRFPLKPVEGLVMREHGRLVQTLTIARYGECYLDLSFMPRIYHPKVEGMGEQTTLPLSYL